ncbi:MAG: hypothetical protein ABI720_03755 [Actinomycetes bacterium]
MSSVVPVALLALAGFCFGGAYTLAAQKKPWWVVSLVAAFGVLSLVAGWLYL